MSEWLRGQWNRLRRRADQLVVVLLLVLLGVMGFFYWVEQQLPAPTIPPLVPQPIPTPPRDPEEIMKRFEHARQVRSAQEFRSLVDFNLFDQRSAVVRSELVARLDKQFESAREAFSRNDLAGARKICNDIIGQMPSHPQAIELLKLIGTKEKEAETQPKP